MFVPKNRLYYLKNKNKQYLEIYAKHKSVGPGWMLCFKNLHRVLKTNHLSLRGYSVLIVIRQRIERAKSNSI